MVCNRIWKKEEWIKECKKGIVPVIKKDEGRKIEDYRR